MVINPFHSVPREVNSEHAFPGFFTGEVAPRNRPSPAISNRPPFPGSRYYLTSLPKRISDAWKRDMREPLGTRGCVRYRNLKNSSRRETHRKSMHYFPAVNINRSSLYCAATRTRARAGYYKNALS